MPGNQINPEPALSSASRAQRGTAPRSRTASWIARETLLSAFNIRAKTPSGTRSPGSGSRSSRVLTDATVGCCRGPRPFRRWKPKSSRAMGLLDRGLSLLRSARPALRTRESAGATDIAQDTAWTSSPPPPRPRCVEKLNSRAERAGSKNRSSRGQSGCGRDVRGECEPSARGVRSQAKASHPLGRRKRAPPLRRSEGKHTACISILLLSQCLTLGLLGVLVSLLFRFPVLFRSSACRMRALRGRSLLRNRPRAAAS